MKQFFFLLCSIFAIGENLAAQKQTFDITTFTPPKGWAKQTTENALQYTISDETKGTYCLITLYKAIPGTPKAKENFDMAWQTLVKEMVTVSSAPEMQPAATENGWDIQNGYAPFESNGTKGIALLVTSSGYEKMVNIIVLTNTDVYEKEMTDFLESISLKKQEANKQQVQTPDTNNNSFVIGSWGKSNSVSQLYNRYGTYSYNKQQYIFNKNGTYTFLGKNYSEANSEILLIKESGTYTMNANVLTIIPKTSVIEAWSKKNGADNYNTLKSSQKRALEKATYQVTMEGKNLILSISKETNRDGRFSNGNYYSYGPPETFTAIKLPGQ